MKQYIEQCLLGKDLSSDEAGTVLDAMMCGQATDAQIAGFLVALRAKGETVPELVGFARVMQEKSLKLHVNDPHAIDIVGTGGDGFGTFNISTVSAFVASGAGVTVAKHGNRAVSSKCGSADLLAALGVNIDVSSERMQQCINEVGIGFLFAPRFHPAMKYAAPARREIGIRTIFNLVGPLTNPAAVRRMVLGTFSYEVASSLSGALASLGIERAFVVSSEEGMDEVSIVGTTHLFTVEKQEIRHSVISPESFGLERRPSSVIAGGKESDNARIAHQILEGTKGPERDIVIANSALGILVAGKATSMEEAARSAAASIDSGKAGQKLRSLISSTSTT